MAQNVWSERALRKLEIFGALPFTVDDLVSVDLQPSQLNPLLKSGCVLRERRGVYRVSNSGTDKVMDAALAITQAIPDAVVSHESAAALLGLSHLTSMRKHRIDPDLTITTPNRAHIGRHGYRTVSATVPETQIVKVGEVRVTNPIRTAIDISRMSDFAGGLAAIDAAMRYEIKSRQPGHLENLRTMVHEEELLRMLKQQFRDVTNTMFRWPGVAKAKRCIELGHPAAESPLESASRANIIDAGLPRPEVGCPIQIAETTFWVDFLWRGQRVIGEADGAMKYQTGNPEVLLAEKRREDALRALGFRVFRWGWEDAVTHPERMVHQLRRVLSSSDFAT